MTGDQESAYLAFYSVAYARNSDALLLHVFHKLIWLQSCHGHNHGITMA